MPKRLLGFVIAFAVALSVSVASAEVRPKPRQAQTPHLATAPATHEVQWGGQWWPATVLDRRPGFTKIHYVGWSDHYDSWVENRDVRRLSSQREPQSTIDVLWGGQWWPGSIVKRRGGLIKVHYTGWSTSWDQWVEPSRVRTRKPFLTSGFDGPAMSCSAVACTRFGADTRWPRHLHGCGDAGRLGVHRTCCHRG